MKGVSPNQDPRCELTSWQQSVRNRIQEAEIRKKLRDGVILKKSGKPVKQKKGGKVK